MTSLCTCWSEVCTSASRAQRDTPRAPGWRPRDGDRWSRDPAPARAPLPRPVPAPREALAECPWASHLTVCACLLLHGKATSSLGDRGWALAVFGMCVAFSDVCVRAGAGSRAASYRGPLVLVVEHAKLEPHLSGLTRVTA